jgi:hypothetical protein
MTSHVSRANHSSTALTYWDVLIIQVTVTNVLRAGMVQNVVSPAIFVEMDCATFESVQTNVKIAIIKTLVVVTTITVDHV